MSLTSKIAKYDSGWKHQFDIEEKRLCPLFGESLIEIAHVGSTAVEGLVAKPELDILIVTGVKAIDIDWSSALSEFGYKRGGDLSSGHQFYKRDVAGIRTHKLHVCTEGHKQIRLMLDFRDALRMDDRLREEYGTLKLYLEGTNTAGISEYISKKAPFIEAVLRSKRLQKSSLRLAPLNNSENNSE